MIAEALLMAATVWYVPGWMRTEVPQEGVMPAMSNAFPKAEIAFKAWEISTEPKASCRRQWRVGQGGVADGGRWENKTEHFRLKCNFLQSLLRFVR